MNADGGFGVWGYALVSDVGKVGEVGEVVGRAVGPGDVGISMEGA